MSTNYEVRANVIAGLCARAILKEMLDFDKILLRSFQHNKCSNSHPKPYTYDKNIGMQPMNDF